MSISISDGVEYYLDLLASLQSDGKDLVRTVIFQASHSEMVLMKQYNWFRMSVIQIHAGDGASFPRIPVVYLEAGFALLKAKRYSDALVVCEEVITSTLDFIPERLLLDADEQQNVADSNVVLEKVDLVLWAGAAHLLQAQAHWKLKDSKEAITNFTRCVHFVPSCVGKPCFVKCVK